MAEEFMVKGTLYSGGKKFSHMIVKDGIITSIETIENSRLLEKSYIATGDMLEIKEGCIIPGIIEGHAHATSGALLFQGIDLYEKETVDEYFKAIDEYIVKNPNVTYVCGRGFINSHFGQAGPKAEYLDKKYPDKFFYIESEDCHSCWVSSNVLRLAGISKESEQYKNGVIVKDLESGEPTGWLKESEMERIKKLFPEVSVEDYKQTILRFQENAIQKGFTAVYEPIFDNEGDYEKRVEAYHQLDLEDLLILDFKIGITIYPEQDISILEKVVELQKSIKNRKAQIVGIKIFIDGVVEGHTAFLRAPYQDKPHDYGYSMWQQEKLNLFLAEAAKNNLDVHIHAIGDGALDVALEGFQASRDIAKSKGLRNSITHLQIVQPDQIKRMKELELIAVTNPYWHFQNPDYFQELELPFLGEERAKNEYPLKSFLENQIVVTAASDWPVSYQNNPLIGMEIGITRKAAGNSKMVPQNLKEALNTEEMLEVLTINGAYQLHLEHEIGTLQVGKRANFIVLDQDIKRVEVDKIAKIKVQANYIDGVAYH